MFGLGIVLTGFFVGIAFCAPVGPVNVLCVRNALGGGFVAGFAAGFGGVVADGLFALVAVLGVTAIFDLVDNHARLVQILGGAIILAVGAAMLMRDPPSAAAEEGEGLAPRGLARQAMAGFALTITNPGPLLGFFALFGGLGEGVVEAGDLSEEMLLVLGVVLGGAFWYAAIAGLVSVVRERIDDSWFRTVNRVAAFALVLFGAALVVGTALRLI